MKKIMTNNSDVAKPSDCIVWLLLLHLSPIIIPLRGGDIVLKLAGVEVKWSIFNVQVVMNSWVPG